MNQVMRITACLFLTAVIVVLALDTVQETSTPETDENGHYHGNQNHTNNIQYGKVTQLGRKGAVETVWQHVIISENLECSKCRMTRLIGCQRGTCYYRCYRRCFDGNGTNWDESIRFTMKGSRK